MRSTEARRGTKVLRGMQGICKKGNRAIYTLSPPRRDLGLPPCAVFLSGEGQKANVRRRAITHDGVEGQRAHSEIGKSAQEAVSGCFTCARGVCGRTCAGDENDDGKPRQRRKVKTDGERGRRTLGDTSHDAGTSQSSARAGARHDPRRRGY